MLSSCGQNGNQLVTTADGSEVPADVMFTTKPLISGDLYNQPSFESTSLVRFDASQEIQVLDTTDAIFIKARIAKDTTEITGFIAKAILPE
ncbi:hypothetical protein C1N53_16510 [Pontibacter sp. SGAir0037]|nr:hypothetical protein C1N53_16510 [Pontibacter sp. SGAir0037]